MLDCLALMAALAAGPEPEDHVAKIAALDAPVVDVGAYFRVDDPLELECRLRLSFMAMDLDSDGYLSGGEIPSPRRVWVDAHGKVIREVSPTWWLDGKDVDGDGRVAWPEMRDHLMPMLSATQS